MNNLNFNSLNLTTENIKTTLYTKFNHLVRVKKHNEYDLYLVNNRWNTHLNNQLYKQLHSVIYKKNQDNDELKPFIYNYPTINDDIRDNFTYDIFTKNVEKDKYKYKVWQSIEGPVITIFYYNDKWHFITTRCWNIDDSIYSSQLSHGKQLDSILDHYGYNREKFTETLDKNISYSFVMVHFDSNYLVDYRALYTQFNNCPGLLVNILNRNIETNEMLDITTKPLSNLTFISYNIIYDFDDETSLLNYIKPLLDYNMISNDYKTSAQGIIVKKIVKNEENNENLMEYFKLHTLAYKNLSSVIPHCNTFIENCITTYQNNKIKYYLEIIKYTGNRAMITTELNGLFNFISNILYSIYKHFTKFDKTNKRYEKINNDDYNLINNAKILKYQLFKLQKLVIYHANKNTYTTTDLTKDDINRHLHNPHYTDSNEIVRLLQDIFNLDVDFLQKLCNNNKLPYFSNNKKERTYDMVNSKNLLTSYTNQFNDIIKNIPNK